MNKRHYEHTLPNIRGSLSNTYNGLSIGKFVDNILRDHFREYGQQYMEQIENAQKVRL